MRVAVMIVALGLTAASGSVGAQPVPTSSASTSRRAPAAATSNDWAQPCVGHFLGSTGDMGFSVDVTSRPLRVDIRFADFGRITGRPIAAIAPGRLRLTDAQTQEIWLMSCRADQIRLNPINMPHQRPLMARRSTKALKMSEDGMEE